MAKFTGNIFGRARNSIGGITFLKSQSRIGSQQTARQRVIPTDRRSNEQMSQRNKMSYAVAVEKLIGTDFLAPVWNRSISKLPPYQSFISYLLKSMDKSNTEPTLGSFLPTIGEGKIKSFDYLGGFYSGANKINLGFRFDNYQEYSASSYLQILLIGSQEHDPVTPSILVRKHTESIQNQLIASYIFPNSHSDYGGLVVIFYAVDPEKTGTQGFTQISADFVV